MKARITLLFVFLVLQAPLTWSQNRIPIQILVESLGDQPCGLTKDAISGRARLTLRQYGFTETATSSPYIYINFNSLELGQQCVGNLTMEVAAYTAQDLANGSMGWVKKSELRFTSLATTGNIFTYPRYDFASKTLDTVENQIKTVLGKIEY